MNKGILKVMSKMGISTYQSYCGAQIFDSIGLASTFVDRYFIGTSVSIEGIGLAEVARETFERHRAAFSQGKRHSSHGSNRVANISSGCVEKSMPGHRTALPNFSMHPASNSRDTYAEFAKLINDQNERLLTIRGLMEFKPAARPLSLDEVEPAVEIFKRFATGAMSFGSISREAHSSFGHRHESHRW